MYKIAIPATRAMSNPGTTHTYARTSHTHGKDPGFGRGRASETWEWRCLEYGVGHGEGVIYIQVCYLVAYDIAMSAIYV